MWGLHHAQAGTAFTACSFTQHDHQSPLCARTLMKLATALVMTRREPALPDTAAKGARRVRSFICFTEVLICWLTSCMQPHMGEGP